MKVYLVTQDTSYEGWAILSVWATRESAEKEVLRLTGGRRDDRYDVEEHEVRE